MAASTLEQGGAAVSSSASIRSRLVRLALAVVLVLVFAFGLWWFAGGTFIGVPQGNSVGTAVSSGEDASIAFSLSADGGDAQLRSVRARVTPNATVEWSAYQESAGPGIGTWHGPLAPTWTVLPVDGVHVSQDEVHPTLLIATVRSATPGVYRVSNITVSYRSGWRMRDAESGFVGCVLVMPANASVNELSANNDPLWHEYEPCPRGERPRP